MESDVIRQEIDATSRRISSNLRRLEERAAHSAGTARAALGWTIAAAVVAGLGLLMTALVRRRHRRRKTTRVVGDVALPDQRVLPFDRIPVARGGARSRPTA